jgi:hypothetical protein
LLGRIVDGACKSFAVQKAAWVTIVDTPIAIGGEAKFDMIEVQQIDRMIEFHHIANFEIVEWQVGTTW